MSITLSSCFYIIKSKFDATVYVEWMNNFISIANNFYLVIYTDENSSKYININNNNKIKVIIKPLHQFYNYKYKDYWIKNHSNNTILNSTTSWELHMLWSEKIWFVNETIKNNYFNIETDLYGWCDIGYFRNRKNDIHTNKLLNWCDNANLHNYDKTKIWYACINNNTTNMKCLHDLINNKNNIELPIKPIPIDQQSIAGGFFIIHKDKIDWWVKTYGDKLLLYFENNYLVKDDQMILADCILSHKTQNDFKLFREKNIQFDKWFMFQRILSSQSVSILMPIYNGIEFIHESVSSIIIQSFNDWELIIGINGHPPNSNVFNIAKQYETLDKRIKVIDLHHLQGKSNALNAMIHYCKHNYIALLDVDDIWHYSKLQTQSLFFNKYDVIGSNCVYFGDKSGDVPKIPQYDISRVDFSLVNPIINSSVIIKKELCQWDNNHNGVEDYHLWLTLRKKNITFYNCPEILVKHRIHKQSAFNSKGNNNKLAQLVKDEFNEN